MAAVRANTILSRTFAKSSQLKVTALKVSARKNPISAKGSAKTVWLNFTNDKYFEIFPLTSLPAFLSPPKHYLRKESRNKFLPKGSEPEQKYFLLYFPKGSA